MTYTEAIVILDAELQRLLAINGMKFLRAYNGKVGRLEKGYYWHPLSQIDRGFQGRKYNIQGDDSGHTESQIIEQPIQITAYSDKPTNHNEVVQNLAEYARLVVQSLPFIEHLKKNGIEVTRPTSLTTMQFINDSDNYEDEVSFQFSIIYTRSIKFNTGVIVENEIETHLINN